MRLMLCVLCLAIWPGIAGAQPVSNFEACVSDAREKHAESTMENYASFKCEGAAAQKLSARPDECSSDVKPSASRIERRSKQLDDGLYLRVTWSTRACAGMCEIRLYNDSRDPNYLCEVRRRTAESRRRDDDDRPPPRYNRRDYPDSPPPRRWGWRPPREYGEPAPYRRPPPEPQEEVRRVERWIYVEPERYREYPRDYYRDDDYRDDDYRQDYRHGYRRVYPY
jgi:hypothetical protein